MLHASTLVLVNGVATPGPPVFQWYRVANTSLASNDPNLRFVTLEGPDWRIRTTDASGNVTFQTFNPQMTIVSGVVGVFHDTMQLK
jgi:hypothetical protein